MVWGCWECGGGGGWVWDGGLGVEMWVGKLRVESKVLCVVEIGGEGDGLVWGMVKCDGGVTSGKLAMTSTCREVEK